MQTKYIGGLIASMVSVFLILFQFSNKYLEINENVFFIVFQIIVFTGLGVFLAQELSDKDKNPKKDKKEDKK